MLLLLSVFHFFSLRRNDVQWLKYNNNGSASVHCWCCVLGCLSIICGVSPATADAHYCEAYYVICGVSPSTTGLLIMCQHTPLMHYIHCCALWCLLLCVLSRRDFQWSLQSWWVYICHCLWSSYVEFRQSTHTANALHTLLCIVIHYCICDVSHHPLLLMLIVLCCVECLHHPQMLPSTVIVHHPLLLITVDAHCFALFRVLCRVYCRVFTSSTHAAVHCCASYCVWITSSTHAAVHCCASYYVCCAGEIF